MTRQAMFAVVALAAASAAPAVAADGTPFVFRPALWLGLVTFAMLVLAGVNSRKRRRPVRRDDSASEEPGIDDAPQAGEAQSRQD